MSEAAQIANHIQNLTERAKAMIQCKEEGCQRRFLDVASLSDHADSVHTYDDIRDAVAREVREQYSRQGTLGQSSVYSWVVDLTDTWVVFEVEGQGSLKLWQADYTINEVGIASLGEPVEVVRKKVYVPAPKES